MRPAVPEIRTEVRSCACAHVWIYPIHRWLVSWMTYLQVSKMHSCYSKNTKFQRHCPGRYRVAASELFMTPLNRHAARASVTAQRNRYWSHIYIVEVMVCLFTIRLSMFLTLARACDKRFSADYDTMLSLLIKAFGPWAFRFYQTVFFLLYFQKGSGQNIKSLFFFRLLTLRIR